LTDNALKINLNPDEERRLDVAFSFCGSNSIELTSEPIITTGVGAIITGGTINPTGSSKPTDTSPFPHIVPTSSMSNIKASKPDLSLEGAWLASHLVIDNPTLDSRDYLPPGRHSVKVDVGCDNGSGDEVEIIIVSNKRYGLLDANLRRGVN
jgi:hypothetical protein